MPTLLFFRLREKRLLRTRRYFAPERFGPGTKPLQKRFIEDGGNRRSQPDRSWPGLSSTELLCYNFSMHELFVSLFAHVTLMHLCERSNFCAWRRFHNDTSREKHYTTQMVQFPDRLSTFCSACHYLLGMSPKTRSFRSNLPPNSVQPCHPSTPCWAVASSLWWPFS